MFLLNKILMLAFFLCMSMVLSSCGEKVADKEVTAKQEDDSSGLSNKEKEAYKAKVSKRMGKVTYKVAVKELGAVGVSESQVKCVLKDLSYASLSLKKDAPEVKAVFEDCGVDMQQLKAWYD